MQQHAAFRQYQPSPDGKLDKVTFSLSSLEKAMLSSQAKDEGQTVSFHVHSIVAAYLAAHHLPVGTGERSLK